MKAKYKVLSLISILGLCAVFSSGCQRSSDVKSINMISREDGSGTRDAFSEIVGLIDKKGKLKTDKTTVNAVVQNSTEAVMSTVADDPNALGYISFGSLNDMVKPIEVNGVKISIKNIEDKKYKLYRPFMIVYRDEKNPKVEDFMKFLFSTQGQAIVKKDGYIPVKIEGNYTSKHESGHLAISGSTSVTPLMEKLVEKYKELNPGMSIDIQSNGSSAGITDSINGVNDIGMSSRDLTPDELIKVHDKKLGIDGIAVIVNKKNKIDDLTLKELKGIYRGEITSWNEIYDNKNISSSDEK